MRQFIRLRDLPGRLDISGRAGGDAEDKRDIAREDELIAASTDIHVCAAVVQGWIDGGWALTHQVRSHD